MPASSIACPICSAAVTHTVHAGVYDDRHGYPGLFSIAKCPNCAHRFLREQSDERSLVSLYTDYYPRKTFTIDQHKPHTEVHGFNGWLDGVRCSAFYWVPEKVRILDIGCGFGESLAYHRLRGCDVYGVEADENVRQVAERFGYTIHIGPFDPAVYEADFFDYVTLDQVIEHVVTPLETLRGIARILKNEGVVILSTPNANGLWSGIFGRKWIHWHVPYHRQYFSRKSMAIAARQAGLKIKEVKTLTNSEWLHYQWFHLLTCPDLGERSSFWSPDGREEQRNLALRHIAMKIRELKVNHVLTRCADMMHLGDNYLFILRKG